MDTTVESGIPKLDEELISCLQTVCKHFIEMQGEASIVDVFMFLEQGDVVDVIHEYEYVTTTHSLFEMRLVQYVWWVGPTTVQY